MCNQYNILYRTAWELSYIIEQFVLKLLDLLKQQCLSLFAVMFRVIPVKPNLLTLRGSLHVYVHVSVTSHFSLNVHTILGALQSKKKKKISELTQVSLVPK